MSCISRCISVASSSDLVVPLFRFFLNINYFYFLLRRWGKSLVSSPPRAYQNCSGPCGRKVCHPCLSQSSNDPVTEDELFQHNMTKWTCHDLLLTKMTYFKRIQPIWHTLTYQKIYTTKTSFYLIHYLASSASDFSPNSTWNQNVEHVHK